MTPDCYADCPSDSPRHAVSDIYSLYRHTSLKRVPNFEVHSHYIFFNAAILDSMKFRASMISRYAAVALPTFLSLIE